MAHLAQTPARFGARRLAAAGFAGMTLAAALSLLAKGLPGESAVAAASAALAAAFAFLPLAVAHVGAAPAAFGVALAFIGALLGVWAAPALALVVGPALALDAAGRRDRAFELGAFSLLGFGLGALLAPAPVEGLPAIALALGALGLALAVPFASAAVAPPAQPADETRLAALEAEAQALRAGLTARAADLGHELRTPIGQMVSFAEMVSFLGPVSEKQREYLDLIQAAGRSALRLAQWLMDFAQIESGRYGFEAERFDARLLADETVRLMAEEAARKGLALTLTAPESAPVAADPRAIRQILQNLLVNAVKFSPEGGQAALRLVATEGALVIEVEDSGPGVPPAERARLTERFARGAAAAGGVEGVGLGLALVSAFASMHGGSVAILDGRALGGALVRVRLPILAPAGGP